MSTRVRVCPSIYTVHLPLLVAACMCCSMQLCVACLTQDMYNYQELKDIFSDLESETSTLVDKVVVIWII